MSTRGDTPPATAPKAPPAPRHHITEFLTDGSLARACAHLAAITTHDIRLHDTEGRAVEPTGDHGWRFADAPTVSEHAHTVPIVAGGDPIAVIVLEPATGLDPEPTLSMARALADGASEVCHRVLELQHRVEEIGTLFKLTSLLVRSSSLETTLEVVLGAALDVLDLDAGSIVLLTEDADGITSEHETDLRLVASRGLSSDWLSNPAPLSADRVFDRLALAGMVLVSEDLASDDRVQLPEMVRSEGVGCAIHAGLLYDDRPLGIIRLYGRRPRAFTTREEQLLASIASQAALGVEQDRLLRIQRADRQTQRQLSLAADAQRRMLPDAPPNFPALDVAARYEPSLELGGDFYDLFDVGNNLGIVISDVVGKGVAAALLMSHVRATLRAHVQDLYDLDEVLARVNDGLSRDTQPGEFATLWYGVIDPSTLRLTYSSAGHDPVLLARPNPNHPLGVEIVELGVEGLVLGVIPGTVYTRATCQLRPGDLLIASTDGVTDARNYDDAKFGKARFHDTIRAALKENPEPTAEFVLGHILWTLHRFVGMRPRVDDVTLAVVRVHEPN